MYTTKLTMEERLLAADVAISNSLVDEVIMERLSFLGYDANRLKIGLELLKRVKELYNEQKKEYGEQFKASEAMYKAWEATSILYRQYSTLARVLFKNDIGTLSKLGLDKDQSKKLSDWVAQANQFYTNAINTRDIQEKMTEYTVTAERLQAALEDVNQLLNYEKNQEKEKSEAQKATEDRNKAFSDLDEYMSDLLQLAKVMLYDKPQLLEKLGIVSPSE
jgi:hypothetical protein